VDGKSTDGTDQVAKHFSASFVVPEVPGLLNARRVGARMARSDVLVMLDSDQVLVPFALEESVKALAENDMVILGEYTLDPSTWIERLYAADKVRLHQDWKRFSDPLTGVLLPRVFKAPILREALSCIPEKVVEVVVTWDHAIIYFEAWKFSQRVGFVAGAVGHNEPGNIHALWSKWFRWGVLEAVASKSLEYRQYQRLCLRKVGPRASLRGILESPEARKTLLIMMLKGLPYLTGYTSQAVRQRFAS
jgi:glycosyltransferase involved in cell wall biosynthesis